MAVSRILFDVTSLKKSHNNFYNRGYVDTWNGWCISFIFMMTVSHCINSTNDLVLYRCGRINGELL